MNSLLPALAQAQNPAPPAPAPADAWTVLVFNFLLPLGLLVAVGVYLWRASKRVKTSIQYQEEGLRLIKEHQAKNEALLERIAKAVEKNDTPSH